MKYLDIFLLSKKFVIENMTVKLYTCIILLLRSEYKCIMKMTEATKVLDSLSDYYNCYK